MHYLSQLVRRSTAFPLILSGAALGASFLLFENTATSLALILCMVTVIGAVLFAPGAGPERETTSKNAARIQPSPRRMWIGLGLVVLVTAINLPDSWLELHYALQLLLLYGGIGLFTWGIGGGALPSIRIRWREHIAILAILVFALVVRTVDLETSIPRFVDELHSISAVTRLWDNPTQPVLTQHGGITAFTWQFPSLQTITVEWFGATRAGVRVAAAVAGTLGVLAVYVTASLLFDRRVALIAALMLAAFPPHLHFSRIGLNNIVDPMFGTLAVGLFVYAGRKGSRPAYALSGACLGLTTYFYEGGRLFYVPLLLTLMALAAFAHRRQGEAIPWRDYRVFGLTWLVTTAPVYITWLAHDLTLIARFSREQGLRLFTLENILDPVRVLIAQPDRSWFYGGEAALLALILPAFLIGFGVVLRRYWRVEYGVLVMWIVGVVLANSLLMRRLDAPRYVVAFPAFALIAALGVDYLARTLLRVRWRQTALALGLSVVFAGASTFYYFDEHLPVYNEVNGQYDYIEDVLFRMVDLPQDTLVNAVLNIDDIMQGDVDIYVRYVGRQDLIYVFLPYFRVIQEPISIIAGDRPQAIFVPANAPQLVGIMEDELGATPLFGTKMGVRDHWQLAMYTFNMPEAWQP